MRWLTAQDSPRSMASCLPTLLFPSLNPRLFRVDPGNIVSPSANHKICVPNRCTSSSLSRPTILAKSLLDLWVSSLSEQMLSPALPKVMLSLLSDRRTLRQRKMGSMIKVTSLPPSSHSRSNTPVLSFLRELGVSLHFHIPPHSGNPTPSPRTTTNPSRSNPPKSPPSQPPCCEAK